MLLRRVIQMLRLGQLTWNKGNLIDPGRLTWQAPKRKSEADASKDAEIHNKLTGHQAKARQDIRILSVK